MKAKADLVIQSNVIQNVIAVNEIFASLLTEV